MPVTVPDRELDDAALVREAQSGTGEHAFTQLYERHKDAVYSFLVRFLRDRALAEDVLQESFYRLFRSLERFDASRPFKPYLHQVVRHAALDALAARAKARGVSAETSEPASADSGPLESVVKQDEESRARDAYDALPEETRLLLLQRHGLDMKLDELAASWECTEKTVRNRLKAAARELAKLFFARRGS